MAVITSAATGDFNAGTTWVGGAPPAEGDTVVIANTHTVTITEDTPVLGSNTVGVGHGVTVQAGGVLLVGATLNTNGFNTSTNKAGYIAPGGRLERISGGNITVTPATDWQTTILNEGDFFWDGGTIKSGEPWNFVERGTTLTNAVGVFREKNATYEICLFYLGGGCISNAAETGIGTPLDNSFVVTANPGGASAPYNAFQQKVASYEALLNVGDYYVDCDLGIIYYWINENGSRLFLSYTVKTHRWKGWGLQSTRNGDSRFRLDNATIRMLGGAWSSRTETVGQAVFMDRRTNPVVNPAREGRVRNCTFEYCTVPLEIYNSTNTSTNPIDCTGNTYNYCHSSSGNFGGIIHLGYFAHGDFSDSKYKVISGWGSGLRAAKGTISRRCTGAFSAGAPIMGTGGIVEDCDFEGYGTLGDTGGLEGAGNATDGPNIYRRNKFRYGNRCGRILAYMIVEDNEFSQYSHHGFVGPARHGFFTGIKIKRNIIRQLKNTGDMAGGWTLGYNYTQWQDDVEIEGNTFDTGNRSIYFNDQEGTRILGTRIKIWNNNLTNANSGITQPGNDSNNQTKKQLLRLDYNNSYGHTNAGNVKQGSPYMGGNEYNVNSGRNVKGIALSNPSSLNSTGKALQLVVSGTPGTDFSMLLSWGGGTAVELVTAQGTATSGTGASNHTTPGTLVDSSKSWVTDVVRLDQGKIISGTGSGQHFMVRTNNATTLTLMPSNEAGTLTAPAAGSVYIVLNSNVTLSDGVQTVDAGLYILEVPLTAGTYTDTAITFASNELMVDPLYVSADDKTPTNSQLATSGLGGVYIGAKAPTLPYSRHPHVRTGGFGAFGLGW